MVHMAQRVFGKKPQQVWRWWPLVVYGIITISFLLSPDQVIPSNPTWSGFSICCVLVTTLRGVKNSNVNFIMPPLAHHSSLITFCCFASFMMSMLYKDFGYILGNLLFYIILIIKSCFLTAPCNLEWTGYKRVCSHIVSNSVSFMAIL